MSEEKGEKKKIKGRPDKLEGSVTLNLFNPARATMSVRGNLNLAELEALANFFGQEVLRMKQQVAVPPTKEET